MPVICQSKEVPCLRVKYLVHGTGMKSLQSFGVSANELRIVGGGSKNPLWRQIIADSFQLPLRFPTEPESAALGGALQAAAVYNNAPVADFILENEPPLADEVNLIALPFHHSLLPVWSCVTGLC